MTLQFIPIHIFIFWNFDLILMEKSYFDSKNNKWYINNSICLSACLRPHHFLSLNQITHSHCHQFNDEIISILPSTRKPSFIIDSRTQFIFAKSTRECCESHKIPSQQANANCIVSTTEITTRLKYRWTSQAYHISSNEIINKTNCLTAIKILWDRIEQNHKNLIRQTTIEQWFKRFALSTYCFTVPYFNWFLIGYPVHLNSKFRKKGIQEWMEISAGYRASTFESFSNYLK